MDQQKSSGDRFRLWLLLPAVLLCSCSRSDQTPVQPVQGRVLVDGKPAAQALVTLHPRNGASSTSRPSGLTDARGNFRLTTFRQGDGAPEGEYVAAVTWFRAVPGRGAGDEKFTTRNFLPGRYANPATSRLDVTISRGSQALAPLRLTSR
jgi:hypothetical protein